MISSRRDIQPKKASVRALVTLGVPRRYIDFEVADIQETKPEYKEIKKTLNKYVKYIHDMYNDRVGLMFYGSNGSGKTLSMSILAKYYYRHYYKVWMGTLAEIINLKFNKVLSESQSDRLYSLSLAEVLIIDEIGKEMQTSTGSNVVVFEEILRDVEKSGKILIVGTNMNLEAIQKDYGASIHSILNSLIKIKMTGEDGRNKVLKESKAIQLLRED